jgi:hypothetical protein
MAMYLFYTKQSPHEASVVAYAHELEQRQVKTELIEADSRRGIDLMALYDLTRRPSAVLTTPDGTMIERWAVEMPPPADVSYMAHR